MRTKIASTVLLAGVLNIVISAQHTGHNLPAGPATGRVDLGEISFPNSGPKEAQKPFIEGVLLLHSFEYERARRSFAEAARIAPGFALAYWGQAMTYDHRIWAEQNRSAALAILTALAPTSAERREKAPTRREKMYMDAVEALYTDGSQAEVAAAYSKAMEKLALQFPDDLEARAFYSLSLLGLTGATRNTENYMRAAAVAEEIYQKNPRHPGALHYLIHAYDDPVHAPLGLRAARTYGTVARSASHAQHMPSHIFFALGMWDEANAANIDSMKTAREEGTGGYHPLHWLLHGYLQLGKVDDATRILDIIENDARTINSRYNRTHLAASRATLLVETRGGGPESVKRPVDSGTGTAEAFSNQDLAIGLDLVRRGELVEAGRTLEQMRTRHHAIKGSSGTDRQNVPSGTAAVMDAILDAAIQFAAGDREPALAKIKGAAETEDKLIFEYGPPAVVKPAWEAAGEMPLAAGRRKEAAEAFRNVLKRYPNRRLSNEGLKQSSYK